MMITDDPSNFWVFFTVPSGFPQVFLWFPLRSFCTSWLIIDQIVDPWLILWCTHHPPRHSGNQPRVEGAVVSQPLKTEVMSYGPQIFELHGSARTYSPLGISGQESILETVWHESAAGLAGCWRIQMELIGYIYNDIDI